MASGDAGSAEAFKTEGNKLVAEGKYTEAAEAYTKVRARPVMALVS
jgi:hypothetical protein